jgi:hypothetical protein
MSDPTEQGDAYWGMDDDKKKKSDPITKESKFGDEEEKQKEPEKEKPVSLNAQ